MWTEGVQGFDTLAYGDEKSGDILGIWWDITISKYPIRYTI